MTIPICTEDRGLIDGFIIHDHEGGAIIRDIGVLFINLPHQFALRTPLTLAYTLRPPTVSKRYRGVA